ITSMRYGEETSGVAETPGTQRCNKVMAAAGLPPVQKQSVAFGGAVCNFLWIFPAAAERSSPLTPAPPAGGVPRVGRGPGAAVAGGPADFSAQGVTTTGQFWRPVQYQKACSCWKVMDPTFRPTHA